ncbi:MAG: hypothetical protein ABI881_06725 [Betaproteobacteria bacterium]
MDAWLESVVLAMAVAAIGFTALGSRFETWRAAPVSVSETRCVALHAGTADHKPKCATTVATVSDPTVDGRSSLRLQLN